MVSPAEGGFHLAGARGTPHCRQECPLEVKVKIFSNISISISIKLIFSNISISNKYLALVGLCNVT